MAPDQSEAAVRHPDAMPPDVLGWAERISGLTDEAILIGKALTEDHPTWQSSDFRRTFFVKYAVVCQATVGALSFEANCLMRNEWWRKPNGILQISPTATDEELNRHARAFLIFTRCGFTHLLFSQIETTLRAFLRALAPRAVNDGTGEFKSIYECLLRTHLEINADAAESPLTRLDFLRTIRNLIHNNGLYRSKQARAAVISFCGTTYRFEHNQHALIVGWPTLIDLVAALLSDMKWVVQHPALAEYFEPILDPVLESEPGLARREDSG